MDPIPIRKPLARELTTSELSLVIRLAKQRTAMYDQLRAALEQHQTDEVYRLARLITGLSTEVPDDDTAR